MSVEKRFRRCADPCQRFLTPDDTHDLCVMCLGEEDARSVLLWPLMKPERIFLSLLSLSYVELLEVMKRAVRSPLTLESRYAETSTLKSS